MGERSFLEMVEGLWEKNDTLVCVGLDPEAEKLPEPLRAWTTWSEEAEKVSDFNAAIIEATKDLVCAYKPNSAFYEVFGAEGLKTLKWTVQHIKASTNVPVILDAKRGDIGNTSEKYAQFVFEWLGADAVTVNPYLGYDALEPFFKYKDKGIIVVVRSPNPGAKDFQNLLVHYNGDEVIPLYQAVGKIVVEWNDIHGNLLMVAGANYPREMAVLREIAPEMPFLIPGVGSQGGDLEETVKAGRDNRDRGMIINSSRGIIYASSGDDFAEAARKKTEELREAINKIRREVKG